MTAFFLCKTIFFYIKTLNLIKNVKKNINFIKKNVVFKTWKPAETGLDKGFVVLYNAKCKGEKNPEQISKCYSRLSEITVNTNTIQNDLIDLIRRLELMADIKEDERDVTTEELGENIEEDIKDTENTEVIETEEESEEESEDEFDDDSEDEFDDEAEDCGGEEGDALFAFASNEDAEAFANAGKGVQTAALLDWFAENYEFPQN